MRRLDASILNPIAARPAAPARAIAWYALKTRSRFERHVAAALDARGVRSFLPLIRERHRWSDRVKDVGVPLFSTYLFVRICPDDRFDVLQTRGAVAILGNGAVPTPIPDPEIEPLIALGAAEAPLERHRFLTRGQRVRIRSGPFRGVEGTLVRTSGTTRVVLAVQLLKQAAALTVDAGDVEACG